MGKQQNFIRWAGNTRFSRYRLVELGKGFWTRDGWSQYGRPVLFCRWQDAAAALREIKIRESADKPRRCFRATVSIDLIGDHQLDAEDLARHLADAARLTINVHPKKSLVLLYIDWFTLTEVESVPAEKPHGIRDTRTAEVWLQFLNPRYSFGKPWSLVPYLPVSNPVRDSFSIRDFKPMSKPRYFCVQQTGSKKFSRYRILDCGKGFWTGDGWSMDQTKACLYWHWEHAAVALREIKILENADKPCTRFKATVTVDLLGDHPLNLEQLAAHLADAARLTIMDQPPGGMLVFMQIDWGTLEELDSTDN
jgi:hypothetical protein